MTATTIASCPTCHGHGTHSRPPWVAGDQPMWVNNGTQIYTCRTCSGVGYIVVPAATSSPATAAGEPHELEGAA